MFRKLSLAAKIGGGFAIVLLLVLLVSLVSWNGLRTTTNGFTTYRGLAKHTNVSGRLQVNMLMMRISVIDFIGTGSSEDYYTYQEYLGKMNEFLQIATEQITEPRRAAKMLFVQESINDYKQGVEKIAVLRKEQNRLGSEALSRLGPPLEENLTKIITGSYANNDSETAVEMGLALRNLIIGRLHVVQYLATNAEVDGNQVDNEMAEFSDKATSLLAIISSQPHRDLLRKTIESVTLFKSTFDLVRQNIIERNSILKNTLNKIGPEVAMAVEEVKMSVKVEQETLGIQLQKKSGETMRLVLLVVAIALASGIFISIVLTRSITRPIQKVVAFVQELAQGNFTSTLTVDRQDEIGTMTEALNDMVKQLSLVIQDITRGVSTLSGSSADLASISNQLSTAAQETSNKSESVSTAAEEMSANMNTVSAAMEQSATNTNMVAAATEEMTATVGAIAKSAEMARGVSGDAVQKSQKTMAKMTELSKGADRIGRVTETITEISEQTNLLALNATIEAARAGEAGKGFAVVANEIKELAKETAAATVDIRTQIEGMQETTSTSVADMNEISDVIDEINSIITTIALAVEEQSVTTNEIVENVAQTSQGIAEVNESVAQSTTVIADIAREISSISSVSSEVDSGSNQVQVSASNLSKLAVELDAMVNKFKV